jgi:hypothetical protein
MTVEGTLWAVGHDAAPGFVGFSEYKLVRAVVRRT